MKKAKKSGEEAYAVKKAKGGGEEENENMKRREMTLNAAHHRRV